MYLVINLAVIDMFIGGIAAHDLFYLPGTFCSLWKWHSIEVWENTFAVVAVSFFIASLTNIAIIALERVHATLFPFTHRVLKKWVHRLIIAVVWFTSGLGAIAFTLLFQSDKLYYINYLFYSFLLFCLLIICVSYTSIPIKVRWRAQPQNHGAASRERKLTMTLLIVTVVSLLLYLPYVILSYVIFISKFKIWWSLPPSVRFHLDSALLIFFYANSLLSILYYRLSACLNTDQLYLHCSANYLSNKEELQFFLFVTCNADRL